MAMNYAVKIAEGVTAKLEFDFACNRGHSFGEYHVHGVVNEILSSNIDPSKHRVLAGYAHPLLQISHSAGRRKEVDFLLQKRSPETNEIYVEVKWAGSSHCSPGQILIDLCRLQIIKNNEANAKCLFMISGPRTEVQNLLKKGFFKQGTQCLLHNPLEEPMNGATFVRKKQFPLVDHPEYQGLLNKIFESKAGSALPELPQKIITSVTKHAISAPREGRFNTLVWSLN